MKKISVKPIDNEISLREACANYSLPRQEFPIKGGWGFIQKDAIIIDRNGEVVSDKENFDGVQLEYDLINERINLEFTYLQKTEDSYRNIYWKVEKQEVHSENNRTFDKLLVRISALPYEVWKSRRKEWKENGHKPDFDRDWFQQKTAELTAYCHREFWFDISSFYGQ